MSPVLIGLAVLAGVAIPAAAAGVVWLACEAVWAFRGRAFHRGEPEYQIVYDAFGDKAAGWSSVDVGNVRYWVPSSHSEGTP